MSPTDFIRELREKAKLTQVEVCRASGLHQANLSAIENGQRVPRITTIAAILDGIAQVASERVESLQGIQAEIEAERHA